MSAKPVFNKPAALLVALAMFAQESVWNFYDAQVPASLRQYIASAGLIGLLMGVDNLLGMFVQPWMAHRSDLRKNAGKGRFLFLLAGAPLAALLFTLIPWADSITTLLVAMVGFAFVANGFKSITESLTADFQPQAHRSKANAVARIGVAFTVMSTAAISYAVVDRDVHVAFLIPALLLVAGMGIACWGLARQPEAAPPHEAAKADDEHVGMRVLLADIFTSPDKRRLLLLLAVFAAQGIWSAIRSQFTPYAMEVLHLPRGTAGSVGFPAGIAFLVAAIPVAILADRGNNRARVCLGGMVLIALGCLLTFLSSTPLQASMAMVLVGAGWAAFAINAVVILWSIVPSQKHLGAYTGFYWTAAALGSTVMPALLGLLVDLTSWRYMMLHAAGITCISILLLLRVCRAERLSPAVQP